MGRYHGQCACSLMHGGGGLQAWLGPFIQGALDVHGASPRRHFFEVLHHFATDELQQERLEHFATPEGREDLALYNQSEGLLPRLPGSYFL